MISDSPRVLMFAPLCYPPAGSEAIVTAKLVIAALNAGWRIDVITQSDFGHYYPLDEKLTWDRVAKVAHCIPKITDRPVASMRLFFGNGFLPLGRRWPAIWAGMAVIKALKLSFRKKYDFILSRATPQYGHLPALFISRWLRIPWIANWSDPLPPVKAPPPYGHGSNAPIPPHLQYYIKMVARGATWHTFPCERLRSYFCQYLPEVAQKSSVIPHPALEQFRTCQPSDQGIFTLCHIGSLTMRDPTVFLEGVRIFRQRSGIGGAFQVRFIGTPLGHLREVVNRLGLTEVVLIEDVKPYDATLRAMAAASVMVVIEAACEESVFFPSKFSDFVQSGRPILAVSPTKGTIADILTAHGGGLAADCRSPIAVADAIQTLYSEWKNGTLDRKYGSSRLFELFGEHRVIAEYNKIFDAIKSRATH